MAYLQIRDIPDDVRDVLAQRAKDRGQSLNSYLRDVVLREASFANNQALIDRVVASRGDSKFTTEDVLAARDTARDTARGERTEGAA
ncbi:FitA-like ribbon-helix-helix domain-containing protein [Nocardioides sp. YJ-D4]